MLRETLGLGDHRGPLRQSAERKSWNGKQNKDEACRQVVWGGGRVKRVVEN